MKVTDKRESDPFATEAFARGWATGDMTALRFSEAGRYRLAIQAAIDAHTKGRSYRRVVDFLQNVLDYEDKHSG